MKKIRVDYKEVAWMIGTTLSEKECLTMADRFDSGYDGDNSSFCELCKNYRKDDFEYLICTGCPYDMYTDPNEDDDGFLSSRGCVTIKDQYSTLAHYKRARIHLYKQAAKIARKRRIKRLQEFRHD